MIRWMKVTRAGVALMWACTMTGTWGVMTIADAGATGVSTADASAYAAAFDDDGGDDDGSDDDD